MNLETIKNNYAQEQGYDNWEAFLNYYGGRHPEWFDQHWTEICIRAQKAALEKAAERVMNDGCPWDHTYGVHKESITNPENLIR